MVFVDKCTTGAAFGVRDGSHLVHNVRSLLSQSRPGMLMPVRACAVTKCLDVFAVIELHSYF